MTAWKSSGPTSRVDPNGVVLVEGSTFCISNADGDIARDGVHGLFVQALACGSGVAAAPRA
jgi:hypothetical protein